MKTFLLALVLIISISKTYSQRITGKTIDSLGVPISGVSVTLETKEKVILAFADSNAEGVFELQLQSMHRSDLIIQASILGYERLVKTFDFNMTKYEFILKQTPIQLDDIYVVDKQPRLRVRGDTITYKVTDFESPQDRVIGDVLKRLPGITVESNGKIFYNGKPISRFYIDGDNLLDDRYNIGTNSIPNTMVDEVEILENHEPVKMKRASSLSTGTALNITLRDGATTQANRLEAGFALPESYDGVLSNINLKKKYKALNQLWMNSTGEDLKDELVSHELSVANSKRGSSPIAPLLSVANSALTSIDQKRYLLNRTGLINTNNLFTLKNEYQLKSKVSYLRDRQLQQYRSNQEIFLSDGSIRYGEDLTNTVKPSSLAIELNLNANKEKYYLDNTARYERTANVNVATLSTNSLLQDQLYKSKLEHLSNEFTISGIRKRGFMEFYSYVSAYRSKQELGIFPPIAPVLFGVLDTLTQLIQNVHVPDFYTNNFFTVQNSTFIKQLYKIGTSIERQNLNSSLSGRLRSPSQDFILDSALNEMTWNRNRFYVEGQFSHIDADKKFSTNLILPVIYQATRYSNKPYEEREDIRNVLINPSLSLKMQVGSESEVNFNYREETAHSSILEVYTGYLMNNYRGFSSHGIYDKIRQKTIRLGYTFRKTPKMLFFNVNALYTKRKSNAIGESIINRNFSINQYVAADNISDYSGFSSMVSKYLFDFTTTLNVGYSWHSNKVNQYLNERLLPYRMNIHMISYNINSKVSQRLFAKYTGRYSISSFIPLENENSLNRTVNSLSQDMEINWVPSDFVKFKFVIEHFYNPIQNTNQKSIYFMDWDLEYRPKKLRCIIDFQLVNIANVKEFTLASLQANNSMIRSTPLRERMAMLKVTFNL